MSSDSTDQINTTTASIGNATLLKGVCFALLAGLAWGLVFVAPVWLSNYPSDMLSFGRYFAFGLIAIPLGYFARKALRLLHRTDWVEALKLALIGNLIYYCGIAAAVQLSGAPVTSALIGTLPIVIAMTANWLARRSTGQTKQTSIAWSRLLPPLLVLALGLLLINWEEFKALDQSSASSRRFVVGIGFGLIALAAWTWYPLRNSQWIRSNPKVSSSTWATAQGLATLPLATLGLIGSFFWHGDQYAWPLGPEPLKFIGIMLLLGLCASWLGTLLWNRASQLLPASLAGQLIVFETIAALSYAYLWRGAPPSLTAAFGIVLLLSGVWLGVRVFQTPPVVQQR